MNDLVDEVRVVVKELLEQGREPWEISFALSFVATDLGFAGVDARVGVIAVDVAGVRVAIGVEHVGRADVAIVV